MSFTPRTFRNASREYLAPSNATVFLGPIDPVTDQPLNKSDIWVEDANFCCADIPSRKKPWRKKTKKWSDENCLIIGFDTEFKAPGKPVTREEMKAGKASYQVLSYQFHCRLPDGTEWSGICCPTKDERLTIGQFLVFALGSARAEGIKAAFPRDIYLVGHFTRADIPAFGDFKDNTDLFANVRNTFVSDDSYLSMKFKPQSGNPFQIRLRIRDTILLAPAGSQSLAKLGELVGRPKLVLDPDPQRELWMKQNMDVVRRDHWDLFKTYALNDAVICVDFIERVRTAYKNVMGSTKVPMTLTSIGVDLLRKIWGETADQNEILGKEEVAEKQWDKKLGFFITQKRTVDLEEKHWHNDFVTASYHGGRNEQFWFGPAFVDKWTDYDLAGAYPTAMSLIGAPVWRDFELSRDPSAFTPTTLGYACVDFSFPDHVRFPTLPIRTPNGLIFPQTGRSTCAAPEVALAVALGADIGIRHGLIVPCDMQRRIFLDFTKYCIEMRNAFPKKSFDALFWKELTNSTYGKTAQGLREKRVFDMRERSTKALPASPITNPYFASYITSFVRGTLGEIINALPPEVAVFSATTDGFLSNANVDQIERAQKGPLAGTFRNARTELTGVPGVLEAKHEIAQPLGWRTRGQATLRPGPLNPNDKTYHIVLAKSGIYTPPALDTDELENEFIVNLFFNRTVDDVVRIAAKTGIRDMLDYDADLVEKNVEKSLNMEFDFKRRPCLCSHRRCCLASCSTIRHVNKRSCHSGVHDLCFGN